MPPLDPLEDHFAPLKQQADLLRDALAGLVRAVGQASSTGGVGSTASAAAGAANAVGQLSRAQKEAAKSQKDLVVQSREFTSALGGLQKATRGIGDLAKALGLESTSRQLDLVSQRAQSVSNAFIGIAALGSALASPFVIATGAILAAVGAVVLYNSELNRVLGTNLGLIESLKGARLANIIQGQAESIDVLREAANKLRTEGPNVVQSIFGVTPEELEARANEIAKEMEQAAAELQKLKDGASGGFQLPPFLEDPGAFVRKLGEELATTFRSTFGPQLQAVLDQLRIRDLLTDDSIARAKQRILELTNETAKVAGDVGAQIEGIRIEAEGTLGPLREARALLSRTLTGQGAEQENALRRARVELIDQEIAATEALAAARAKALEQDTPFSRFKANLAEIGDITQQTFDFLEQGIQAVSATISSAILDAFLDPQADIRESFAQLFRALAQQLLQILIQALAVRALTSVGLLGASEGGQVAAASSGGLVQGFAEGGWPGLGRPPGIAASDRVPALLTEGEVVEPVPTVRYYGGGLFEALRRRLIPRHVTDAIMDGIHVPTPRVVPRYAYASGGPVGPAPRGGPADPSVTLAVVPPTEQTMENLINGGPKALARFIDKQLRGRA